MSDAAGDINVVLSVNKASFSAAMADAQRNLDKFANKSKAAGHASVSSTQAASAALRVLQGDMTNNIRAVERFVGSIPGVGAALKNIFPLVGLVAFGGLLASLGTKVADFVEKANKMPKAIQMGFASMQLASQSSADALRLTNDKLQNAIDKLEGKPQNNLAIEFDEAAVAADKLATSIERSNDKINQLLSQDHLSGLALLTGKMGTADREGTLKYWGDRSDSNAYDLANATDKGDPSGIAKAKAAMAATQAAELANLRGDLSNREANSHNDGALNDSANINIDKGAITAILNQQKEQSEEVRNASLAAQKQKLDDAKAATEQAKQAAQQRLQAMTANLEAMKLQNNLSIKQVYDYWGSMKSQFSAGSTAYNEVVAKQTQAAVEGAKAAHEAIAKSIAASKQGRIDDATTGPALINQSASFMRAQAVKSGNEQTQGYIDSNADAMDFARNTAREKEADLNEKVGKSITKMAAAQELANIHTQEYVTIQESLQAIVDARIADDKANPTAQSARAVTMARAGLSNASTQRNIQIGQDQQSIMPDRSSALVGAKDALNDFVIASRDAARMMHDIVTNTLSSLNQQLLNGMTGGKMDFSKFGKSVATDVGGKALTAGEGSAISMLGIKGVGVGKQGSKTNPMYVKDVDAAGPGGTGGVTKGASGLMGMFGKNSNSDSDSGSGSGGGGFLGFLGKLFGGGGSSGSGGGDDMASPFSGSSEDLPAFANGGQINGPAIIGERGEEIWTPPEAGGKIIPNNKIGEAMGGGSSTSLVYNIDAKGTDPVQTEMRVKSAIAQSHQSAVHQALIQNQQQTKRTPRR